MKQQVRPKVAIIFAGGAALSDGRRTTEVRSPRDVPRWVGRFPELQVMADLDPVFVTARHGSDIGPDDWTLIARAIQPRLSRVDGVVVLHGSESIHVTANALSLMLQRVPIPIVLTGTVPSRTARSRSGDPGSRVNILNAVQVATADLAEVCVVFGNRILRGSRVVLTSGPNGLHFTTPDALLIGRLDFGTKLFADRLTRGRRRTSVHIQADANVVVTTVAPGLATPWKMSEPRPSAVLFRIHEPVILPRSFGLSLDALVRSGLPVAVYANRRIVGLPASVAQLVGCTPSMAVVKTMWAAARGGTPASIRRLLEQDVAGEFSPSGGGV